MWNAKQKSLDSVRGNQFKAPTTKFPETDLQSNTQEGMSTWRVHMVYKVKLIFCQVLFLDCVGTRVTENEP